MKLAIAQINTRPGDLETLADRVVQYSKVAADRGADLVAFPMCAVAGQRPTSGIVGDSVTAALLNLLNQTLPRLECPCVVPYATSVAGGIFNEAFYAGDGKVVPLHVNGYMGVMTTLYYAHHQTEGVGAEDLIASVPTFECGGSTLAVAFTEDDLEEAAENTSVDAVLYFGRHPYAQDNVPAFVGGSPFEAEMAGYARAGGWWLAGIASVGGYGRRAFAGGSFVLTPDGRPVALGLVCEEDLIIADVGAGVETAEQEMALPEVYTPSFFCWDVLAMALRDYVDKGLPPRRLSYGGITQGSDFALALTGSITSMALVALAVDACGPTRVHVLICTEPGDGRHDACIRLVRTLRVDARMPDADADLSTELARMARECSAQIISSADKTWYALTCANDPAAQAVIAPFGDVLRSDVVSMLRSRNSIFSLVDVVDVQECDLPALGANVVWEDHYDQEPSPERKLFDIDQAIIEYLHGNMPEQDSFESEHDNSWLVEVVVDQMLDLEMWRRTAPPYVVASECPLELMAQAFGMAWRWGDGNDTGYSNRWGIDAMFAAAFSLLEDDLEDGEKPSDQPDGSDSDDTLDADDFSSEESQVGEMLANLWDLSAGGGLRPEGFGTQEGLDREKGPQEGQGPQKRKRGGSGGASGSNHDGLNPFSKN